MDFLYENSKDRVSATSAQANSADSCSKLPINIMMTHKMCSVIHPYASFGVVFLWSASDSFRKYCVSNSHVSHWLVDSKCLAL
jgi:hypothetical protein